MKFPKRMSDLSSVCHQLFHLVTKIMVDVEPARPERKEIAFLSLPLFYLLPRPVGRSFVRIRCFLFCTRIASFGRLLLYLLTYDSEYDEPLEERPSDDPHGPSA